MGALGTADPTVPALQRSPSLSVSSRFVVGERPHPALFAGAEVTALLASDVAPLPLRPVECPLAHTRPFRLGLHILRADRPSASRPSRNWTASSRALCRRARSGTARPMPSRRELHRATPDPPFRWARRPIPRPRGTRHESAESEPGSQALAVDDQAIGAVLFGFVIARHEQDRTRRGAHPYRPADLHE